MKYDFGFTSPSRLSVRAESSKAIPVREEVLLQHGLARNVREAPISPSTRAVRDAAAALMHAT